MGLPVYDAATRQKYLDGVASRGATKEGPVGGAVVFDTNELLQLFKVLANGRSARALRGERWCASDLSGDPLGVTRVDGGRAVWLRNTALAELGAVVDSEAFQSHGATVPLLRLSPVDPSL